MGAHGALLLLVFANGGVVHHDQEGVVAIPQTGENVLKETKGKKKSGEIHKSLMFLSVFRRYQPFGPADISQCSQLLQAVRSL